MKKLVVLCVVMVLGFVSFAFAGGISQGDARFLFGNDQAVVANISDLEMEQTQGQLALILPVPPANLTSPLSLEVYLLESSTILGVNVKSPLINGGLASPVLDLLQTLPLALDTNILTNLLGGGLDTSILTDLLGGVLFL